MRRLFALFVLVLCGATSLPAQRRGMTVEDVLQIRSVGAPAVSPDGQHILYTVRGWAESPRNRERVDSRQTIWRVASGGGAARQLTFGERGDSQPQWSPNGQWVTFLSARGDGTGDEEPRPQLYAMAASGGEPRKVLEVKEGVRAYAWSPDSSRIAYVATDPRADAVQAALRRRDDERVVEGDFRFAHLWVADVATGSTTRLTRGTELTVTGEPSWAPDGTRLVFAAKPTEMLRDNRSDLYVVQVGSQSLDKITTNPGPDTQPRWSPDGATIAFTAELDPGKAIGDGTFPSVIGLSKLMFYDVAARRIDDVSRPEFDLEVGPFEWSADSQRILFLAGARAYRDAFVYDRGRRSYMPLSRQKTLAALSTSRDGRVVAVAMDTPALPAEIYVTGPDFASFRAVTVTNPQAAEFLTGESEVVTWKSRDGLEVEGVLLKPVDYRPGQRVPTLVVAHGGPAGVFVNGYRGGGLEAGQVLAAQGWAVFYPNPRGSTNYGEKFLRANINDWGGGDYQDIMSGVDALIARGIADPDRLAHIGWSYGGYMTAWVITQTDRFKAAMVGAGLTNMWSMYGTNDIPNVLLTYFGGMPNASTLSLYNGRSAMSHVERVTTPTLILHGGNDERVPIGQAQELFRALKDRGKTTELVIYPREGHGIQEFHHQKDRLERIHAWITTHTLGDGARRTTQR